VASQSNGQTAYHIVDGSCNCKDYPQAPQGFCKHRLAYGIHKRAMTLAKQNLAQLDGASNGTTQPPAESPQGQPQREAVPALPEAPASANCHITIAGRQVQVTLRDTDERRLLARLVALLQQFPVAQPPTPPPTQSTAQPAPDDTPYCHVHKVVL